VNRNLKRKGPLWPGKGWMNFYQKKQQTGHQSRVRNVGERGKRGNAIKGKKIKGPPCEKEIRQPLLGVGTRPNGSRGKSREGKRGKKEKVWGGKTGVLQGRKMPQLAPYNRWREKTKENRKSGRREKKRKLERE